MAHLALSLAIVGVMAGSARAEIAIEAGVPFTETDLAWALALRGAIASDVAVRGLSPTLVEVRTPVGVQRVNLGAARGAAAARLVALQVAAFDVAPVPVAASLPRDAAPAERSNTTFSVATVGGRGIAAIDFEVVGLRADATDRSGPWRWGVGAEWLYGVTKSPDQRSSANANLYLLRAFAGLATGPLQVVAGPELVAYDVAVARPGFTLGINGEVRVWLTHGPRWRALANVDVDGFLHRVVVERDGVQFAATPWIALTASLGLAWGHP